MLKITVMVMLKITVCNVKNYRHGMLNITVVAKVKTTSKSKTNFLTMLKITVVIYTLLLYIH